MTLAERGAYSDLLFFSWDSGPLPDDPARLARLLGCTPAEFAKIWPQLRSKFTATDHGLVNDRLEAERANSIALRAKASEKAQRAASARWANAPRNASSMAGNAPSDTWSNASSMSPDARESARSPTSPALAQSMLGAMLEQCPPSPSPASKDKNRVRGSKRVPEDFRLTEEQRAWVVELLPDLDVDAETAKFRDHEFQRPYVDWAAAWRNWIRNCKDRGGYSRRAVVQAQSAASPSARDEAPFGRSPSGLAYGN
jgi:uncharacterized protein YdaU (DUF1376 family)